MSKRNKAIAILKSGRDALLDRLTEAVLDNSENLFNDFNGWGEGEDVLELGERLFRLNRVLEVLPPDQAQQAQQDKVGFDKVGFENSITVDAGIPVATWDSFVMLVEANDLDGAAYTLAALAQINMDVARQATHILAQQLEIDSGYRAKAMSMRAQLGAGKPGSMTLIHELFGIRGPFAERVYENLRVSV